MLKTAQHKNPSVEIQIWCLNARQCLGGGLLQALDSVLATTDNTASLVQAPVVTPGSAQEDDDGCLICPHLFCFAHECSQADAVPCCAV
jgi:hypothetical protein